jgi:hypothetical protein
MYSERACLTEKGEEIRHNLSPDDLLLNLSQMRNALITQQWQPPFPLSNITIDDAAIQGVALQYQRIEDAAEAKRQRAEQKEKSAKRSKNSKDWRPKVWRLGEAALDSRL